MSRKTSRWLTLIGVAAALLAIGLAARFWLGIEMTPQSLRSWVLDAGPVAPVVCVLMVALRSLIGIPSQLVLVVAGLSFGAAAGTLYGTLGLELSGLATFQLARLAGRDAVHKRIPERLRPIVQRAGDRPGALFIAVGTAYPIGVLTAYHALAGVTHMRLGVFAVALALGSTVRAGTYAFFGQSLVAGGIRPILEATVLISLLMILPLLFSSSRAWVLRVILGREDSVSSTARAADSTPNPP
jgi:uncharacterized membrane protein YdjX (TVP38/TMEM64 family)